MKFIETTLWQGGKERCVTFSYDDGRIEDVRLVEMFNRYGLKGTFHLNNPGFEEHFKHFLNDPRFVSPDDYKTLYEGHEISCHTAQHPFLYYTPDEYIRREIRENRIFLEKKCNYPVRGMSYPFSSFDQRVIDMCRAEGMEYARTATQTMDFGIPSDFMRWDGTCHHASFTDELWERFTSPMLYSFMRLFYVWGHSYEFSTEEHWERMEKLCETVSGREDVWYATNIEIVDYLNAVRALRFTADCSTVYNPSAIDVWIKSDHDAVCIPAGKTVAL
ncbi:MAG: polysaccharide deacetylase family protein [Clostridia bacterium]|nr:polysaccharide deacetylase family protein [Clostridia bacterium]